MLRKKIRVIFTVDFTFEMILMWLSIQFLELSLNIERWYNGMSFHSRDT